jgi:hypothetical protein
MPSRLKAIQETGSLFVLRDEEWRWSKKGREHAQDVVVFTLKAKHNTKNGRRSGNEEVVATGKTSPGADTRRLSEAGVRVLTPNSTVLSAGLVGEPLDGMRGEDEEGEEEEGGRRRDGESTPAAWGGRRSLRIEDVSKI